MSEPTTVYFDFGSFILTQTAKQVLDSLKIPNKDIDKVEIVVVGHTDSKATDNYNNDLSAKRALSVTNYLKDRGLDVYEQYGVGEKYPVIESNSPIDLALNRRVEIFFRIYKKIHYSR